MSITGENWVGLVTRSLADHCICREQDIPLVASPPAHDSICEEFCVLPIVDHKDVRFLPQAKLAGVAVNKIFPSPKNICLILLQSKPVPICCRSAWIGETPLVGSCYNASLKSLHADIGEKCIKTLYIIMRVHFTCIFFSKLMIYIFFFQIERFFLVQAFIVNAYTELYVAKGSETKNTEIQIKSSILSISMKVLTNNARIMYF